MSNLPVFAISPKHTTLDFPDGWTVENKIDVFAARIEGWNFFGISGLAGCRARPH